MIYSKTEPTSYVGLVAPYNKIPDFTKGLVLPETITVLYCRLSSDDKQRKGKSKDDDSDSIANQKLILARFAQDERLPNPIFFVDDGITGTTFNREGVQAALELVEAGRVKNFIVKDLSRFGRDRLKVDAHLEITFPDCNVRFVAKEDNIDSAKGENDMTPIRSLFNEMYAKDCSRKTRAVNRAKGMAGERLSHHAPYGYLKDPNDKKKWVVDEVASAVVKKIFHLCLSGLGITHIANRLRDEKISTPTYHYHQLGLKTIHSIPEDPYDWTSSTVRVILACREYLGHTVNFKTTRKSFKNKTVVRIAPQDQAVFENTHPALIDQETFDRVQIIREGRRRTTKRNTFELFSGLAFCEECGCKLSFSSRERADGKDQSFYVCIGHRNKRVKCSHSHYISTRALEQMVSLYLERVKELATKHEDAFVRYVMRGAEDKSRKALSVDKKQLAKMQSRVLELDTIIAKLFEKNAVGTLSDERFIKLSEGYEREQKDLEVQTRNLAKQIESHEHQSVNVQQFLKIVRKQTNVTELTPLILNEMIEKIEVHAPDKSSGERIQEITIHLNFIGAIGKLDFLKSEEERAVDGVLISVNSNMAEIEKR